ncbi:hypothetical protein A8C75_11605 [Marinobacterium aestuarii]|uniref:AAA+ ATPase domain-containing protein n=1 Tax=Marinobacterium aestuarii TaxID=1821621 RepID=A0A1A9EY35_9GAMM|nr:TniB family NTP-binding protein [Marinobacterium aestuarii]ANG63054.1 hypothetical protein A8C75_11605 [Marinobacterium aestuarii]
MSDFLINPNPRRKSAAIEFLEIRILHTNFIKAVKAINNIHATRGFQPRGMMLVGETGVGKTSAILFYISEYCRLNEIGNAPGEHRLPILLLRVTAESTKKDFLRKMCERLGHYSKGRITESEYETKAETLLNSRNVELVIIDEFHHLADRYAKKNAPALGNLIKNLMEETGIPFILAGTMQALSVLNGHPELQRRFAASTVISNLSLATGEDMRYCRRVLVECEKAISIPTITLSSPEMANRFMLASKGRIANIMSVIEAAIGVADEVKGLTLADLACGFEQRRPNLREPACNPFSASLDQVRRELGKRS